MSSHFIDLTLPAHDPNFPKPRGLPPVPPYAEKVVAREEARIAREHGFQIAPEARQRMLDDWTLNYYHDGAYIAYRRTPQGIEVLAVGWDEASKYLEDHPPETRQDVLIGVV
jgi:hypothetical protein